MPLVVVAAGSPDLIDLPPCADHSKKMDDEGLHHNDLVTTQLRDHMLLLLLALNDVRDPCVPLGRPRDEPQHCDGGVEFGRFAAALQDGGAALGDVAAVGGVVHFRTVG
eukprot:CAMPEP_0203851580 /NCGR_PEP_ID=MMETSP0359-20131031/7431_1 /ASSEMBLY_ACC=CAM_ASM_000338 /TAXON_ID=268821 /ORGANISM="Scrippsiella Hangoei, Strain SHTV-5" /LENGTH=108 /DNA_ID=CAMNT_0050767617 /DNA_START=73 /DNA_END=396 /DNA_ORIENTATION=+